MQITGTLYKIFDTQVVSEKFSKRALILSVDEKGDGKYVEKIQLELQGDKCDLIDPYTEGQSVTIDFNLRGREWTNPQGTTVYFNTLAAWKIQPKDAVNKPISNHTSMANVGGSNAPVTTQEENELPF